MKKNKAKPENTVVEPVVEAAVEPVVEQKKSHAVLKNEYAELKDAAKLAGEEFTQTFAEYKKAYNAGWDLDHPNAADALSTEQILNVVEGAEVALDQAVATVNTEVQKSKAQIAAEIFEYELKTKTAAGLVRKDIIKRFMNEALLTEPGANTYYQNLRQKHKLVAPRASGKPAPVAAAA